MIQQVSYEPPRIMNTTIVQHHEPTSKNLLEMARDKIANTKTLLTKARKFLENNCIKRTPYSITTWECYPIKYYNKTIYTIRLTESGWLCTCQGFKKRLKDYSEGHSDIKPICSHILAVKQLNFIKEFNKEND